MDHSVGGFCVPAAEVGRICLKLSGREAGRKCVVVDLTDKSFVLITGPKEVTGVKRRRVNINHIEPSQDSIEIQRGASDEEVTEALKSAGKLEAIAQAVKPALD
jgi:large subunit ribosomal protein L14e